MVSIEKICFVFCFTLCYLDIFKDRQVSLDREEVDGVDLFAKCFDVGTCSDL